MQCTQVGNAVTKLRKDFESSFKEQVLDLAGRCGPPPIYRARLADPIHGDREMSGSVGDSRYLRGQKVANSKEILKPSAAGGHSLTQYIVAST